MRKVRANGPLVLVFLIAALAPAEAAAATASGAWWLWPIALFAVTFVFGIVAVLAGIGGGVLFVPIVGSFFPFHFDFVRGAGILLALAGSLAAAPALLRGGLASLRLAMPLALAGSIASTLGAIAGLALPTALMQTALGVLILAIASFMWRSKISDPPQQRTTDEWSAALGLHGVFSDVATTQAIDWKAHRTPAGLAAFAGIGLVGGMFGLGAGWANVPALNLIMGVPLKLSIGTSTLAISIINTSAAWVYLNRGALLVILAVPSILGVMLGASVGGRLLRTAPVAVVRRIMLGVLIVAGGRALGQGLGIWN